MSHAVPVVAIREAPPGGMVQITIPAVNNKSPRRMEAISPEAVIYDCYAYLLSSLPMWRPKVMVRPQARPVKRFG